MDQGLPLLADKCWEMTNSHSKRLKFWDDRSSLGFAAGSGDTNLKQLEINAIRQAIKDPKAVLDAGCGNGYTLASLAEFYTDAVFYGFDYSHGMVESANQLMRDRALYGRVKVCPASLLDQLPNSLSSFDIPKDGFDYIYTERSLINLDTLEQQSQAVHALWDLLAPGGSLVLCEAFHDGLNEINAYRAAVDLPQISPPWHNRYLSLSELDKLLPESSCSPRIIEFSGTYYFVSRVLHAREASLQNQAPSYDSAINKQSLDLPSLSMFGQSKLVIFQKS